MNWQKLIKSRVMSAKKLGDRVVIGIIEEITTDEMQDPTTKKMNSVILCKVSGEEVPFRLNIGNMTKLAKAWGEEIDNWIGKKVKIYVVEGRATPSGPGKGLEFDPITKK